MICMNCLQFNDQFLCINCLRVAACQPWSPAGDLSQSVSVSGDSRVSGRHSRRQFLASILGFKLEIWESFHPPLTQSESDKIIISLLNLSLSLSGVHQVILVNFPGEILVFVSIRVRTRKRARIKTVSNSDIFWWSIYKQETSKRGSVLPLIKSSAREVKFKEKSGEWAE